MPADRRTPSLIDRHVGRRVRAARELRGLSQERLAELLGLSFQQIQKYEAGKNRISASRLHQIAGVATLPVEFFYKGAQEVDDPVALAEIALLRSVMAVQSPASRDALKQLADVLADRDPPPAEPEAPAPAARPRRARKRRA